jgi:hypothetical protein
MFTVLQPSGDRRRTPRVAVGNLIAALDLQDGSEPVLVCIWDLSLGGACLMVPPDLKIPKCFDLYIDGLRHPVETIWRRWTHIGVRLRLDTSAGVEPRSSQFDETYNSATLAVLNSGKDR